MAADSTLEGSQKTVIDVDELAKMQATYGHALVDEALRQTLVTAGVLVEHDSILNAILVTSGSNVLVEIDHPIFGAILSELDLIGKPVELAPVEPGAVATPGTTLGILGNPPEMNVAYAGGWHFAQDNGWDAWFTFVPHAAGGYRVATPACRPTGEHGTAIRGDETEAYLLPDGKIYFQVSWHNGTSGAYTGGFDSDGVLLRGQTGGTVNWVGSRMPIADVVNPPASQPVISVSAVPNTTTNGYNVMVGGAGFVAGVRFEVQGRVTGEGVSHDWGMYAEGQTDAFGRFEAAFGVVKPLGYSYVFRALVENSGLTGEVGI